MLFRSETVLGLLFDVRNPMKVGGADPNASRETGERAGRGHHPLRLRTDSAGIEPAEGSDPPHRAPIGPGQPGTSVDARHQSRFRAAPVLRAVFARRRPVMERSSSRVGCLFGGERRRDGRIEGPGAHGPRKDLEGEQSPWKDRALRDWQRSRERYGPDSGGKPRSRGSPTARPRAPELATEPGGGVGRGRETTARGQRPQ